MCKANMKNGNIAGVFLPVSPLWPTALAASCRRATSFTSSNFSIASGHDL